jgi:hypothetical protein
MLEINIFALKSEEKVFKDSVLKKACLFRIYLFKSSLDKV